MTFCFTICATMELSSTIFSFGSNRSKLLQINNIKMLRAFLTFKYLVSCSETFVPTYLPLKPHYFFSWIARVFPFANSFTSYYWYQRTPTSIHSFSSSYEISSSRHLWFSGCPRQTCYRCQNESSRTLNLYSTFWVNMILSLLSTIMVLSAILFTLIFVGSVAI